MSMNWVAIPRTPVGQRAGWRKITYKVPYAYPYSPSVGLPYERFLLARVFPSWGYIEDWLASPPITFWLAPGNANEPDTSQEVEQPIPGRALLAIPIPQFSAPSIDVHVWVDYRLNTQLDDRPKQWHVSAVLGGRDQPYYGTPTAWTFVYNLAEVGGSATVTTNALANANQVLVVGGSAQVV